MADGGRARRWMGMRRLVIGPTARGIKFGDRDASFADVQQTRAVLHLRRRLASNHRMMGMDRGGDGEIDGSMDPVRTGLYGLYWTVLYCTVLHGMFCIGGIW